MDQENGSDWVEEAVCRQVGTELFFPPDDKPVPRDFYARAKTVCKVCDVRAQCLWDGIDEKYGIWGGTTPVERTKMRDAKRGC